jgi:hypothetical protein
MMTTQERNRDYDFKFADGYRPEDCWQTQSHLKLFTPEEQRANLKKLADFLATSPLIRGKFHMGWFTNTNIDGFVHDPDLFYEHKCGTSACALGWAPYATGIAPYDNVCWVDYGASVLGSGSDDVYEWLFADNWKRIDNTPDGAAWRINYYLEQGLPPMFTDVNGYPEWDTVAELFEDGGYDEIINY